MPVIRFRSVLYTWAQSVTPAIRARMASRTAAVREQTPTGASSVRAETSDECGPSAAAVRRARTRIVYCVSVASDWRTYVVPVTMPLRSWLYCSVGPFHSTM